MLNHKNIINLIIYLSILKLITLQLCYAQLVTNNTLTPTQLVEQVLVGSGVKISNVTFTGNPNQRARFFATPNVNLGLTEGILLSTGEARTSVPMGPQGPNTPQLVSTAYNGAGDNALQSILGSTITLADAAVLEFDFIPRSDTISFRYIFASDEYPDYINTSYNDVFALILNGVNTPLAPVNIAKLPNGLPVTINNVNHLTNSQYYRSNASNNINLKYNGLTVLLKATHTVVCGFKYHLKIAIADGADATIDSGIFLEAKSLQASNIKIQPVGVIAPIDSILCQGLSTKFSITGNNGTNFKWNFGDASTLSDTSRVAQPSYTYPSSGVYSVNLIVFNANPACNDTIKKAIKVSLPLNPNIVGQTAFCFSNNINTYIVNGHLNSPTTFTWNFGANALPAITTNSIAQNIKFNIPAIHTISLTVQEMFCKVTVTKTVNVIRTQTLNLPSTFSNACVGNFLTFISQSDVNTATQLLWNFSNNIRLLGENATHQFTIPGVYNASLSILNFPNCTDSLNNKCQNCFTIFPMPISSFSVDQTEVNLFDMPITFANNTYTLGEIIEYSFGNGDTKIGDNPFYEYKKIGDYLVSCTVTKDICKHTTTKKIRVISEYKMWIPTAFTPFDKDQLNQTFKPILLNVSDVQLEIYNRNGYLIFKSNNEFDSWDGKYNDINQPAGVYIWTLTFKNLASKKYESHQGQVYLIN